MGVDFNPEDRVRNIKTNEEMDVRRKLFYHDFDKNQDLPNGKYECNYYDQKKDAFMSGEFNEQDLESI